MASHNRYPLPQIERTETYRDENGMLWSTRVQAINWNQIIRSMKMRQLERQTWKLELSSWLMEVD